MDTIDELNDSENTARLIVQELAGWVNAMGHENRAFANAVMDKHRTIQQQLFETMLFCFDMWAGTDSYDLRNEFTVLKSREIMSLFPGGPSVPLI